jgi:hypothetical protein
MDDLEVIRRFRDDVPSADADTIARARCALLSKWEAPSRASGRRPRSRRMLPWSVAAGVAAAAVVIAVAIPVVLPGGGSGGAPSAAAKALHRASNVAARQPVTQRPGPDQYVFTKTTDAYLNVWADVGPNQEGFSVLMPGTREAWIRPDGAGRLLETTGTPVFLSEQDRAVWIASGSPDLGGNRTTDETYSAGQRGLYYMDLSNLPTDPVSLKSLIEERKVEGGPPGDAETFTIIGDMLRETYAPPELRAALFQIASELPGVELVGNVKDEQGRDGVAVGYTTGGLRQELIFDPNTSALLGERTVVTDPSASQEAQHLQVGDVVGWAAYLSTGIVDSTTERA